MDTSPNVVGNTERLQRAIWSISLTQQREPQCRLSEEVSYWTKISLYAVAWAARLSDLTFAVAVGQLRG